MENGRFTMLQQPGIVFKIIQLGLQDKMVENKKKEMKFLNLTYRLTEALWNICLVKKIWCSNHKTFSCPKLQWKKI